MILICSKKGDLSAERISDKLSQRNIETFNLFIDNYLSYSPRFVFEKGDIANQISIDLSKITAVYFRIAVFPTLPNSKMPEMYQDFLNRELTTLFLGQLMSLDVKWVVNPFYAHLATYKIVQLGQAKRIGFDIPETCVSTNRQTLFDFYQKKKEQNLGVVTKAIHLGYVQSKNPDEDEFIFTQDAVIESINDIPENHPLLLQEKIAADYEIRCFVINNRIFPIKLNIPKTCIDYRVINISEIKAEPVSLPEYQEQFCLRLTHYFHLYYAAIDLLFSKGRYFFLDFNPAGEWLWYENNTFLPLSQTIVDLLIN